jgi:hypothetical protein|tara:strand:- start:180 stop:494 length:315 start_codon:yes stop_codon:yes gene_type:complete
MSRVPLTISTFRGEFSSTTPTGRPITYIIGDIVLYEGKIFIALNTISGLSPDQTDLWSAWGGSRISYRSTIPTEPLTGDMWFNTNTGTLYTYLDDGETKQFVEL